MSKLNAKTHVDLVKRNPDLIQHNDLVGERYAQEYLANTKTNKGWEIVDLLTQQWQIWILNKQIVDVIKNLKQPSTFVLEDKQSEKNLSLLKEYFPEFSGEIWESIWKYLSWFINFCYKHNKAQNWLIKEEVLPNEEKYNWNDKIGNLRYRSEFISEFWNILIKDSNDINIVDWPNVKFVVHINPIKTGEIKTPKIKVFAIQESNSQSDKIFVKELQEKADWEYVEQGIQKLKQENKK